MMDWTEKYRPKNLGDVIGNPTAVNTLRSWAEQWKVGTLELKVAILMGSPGVGKTTSAEALANEMGWDIVEMNASDQRTAKDIERVAIGGSCNNSFADDGSFMRASDGKRKLIVLDEADNLFGNSDRGAPTAINHLMTGTKQPVIMIVNDFYALKKKVPAVDGKTLQITFKKPMVGSVVKALAKIAESENVTVDPEALQMIAENASGDMRAAVRNLESLALGQDHVTVEMAEGLSMRDSREDIFALMSAIFRSGDPAKARMVGMDVDEEPRDILSWVDENLPTECPDPGDLVRGYDRLSRSDLFLSRVMSRQYYGFWSYAKDLMTFGVAASKQSRSRPGSRMNFPGIARKIKAAKKVREIRYSVCLKLAEHLHTTSYRIQTDVLLYIREMMQNDAGLRVPLTDSMNLEPDELAFLIGKKSDSKAVKSVYEDIEKMHEENIINSFKESKTIVREEPRIVVETVKVEAPVKEETQERPRSGGQKSLFDF